jgi:transglutaminase-like putative cysteine protease
MSTYKKISVFVGIRLAAHTLLGVAILIFCLCPNRSFASCNLQITSAGPCLPDSSPGTPYVGEAYALKITVKVVGTPSSPFRIKWTIANVTYYFDDINIGPGNGYWWYFVWWVDLDDSIPWTVTLDPDGVSGNTNLVGNFASGTFTPIPPTNAVELYSPRMMHGYEYYTLVFRTGSGNLNNLWVVFGVPTTHGAQSAISVTSPTNGQTIITPPCSVPVFVISRTNVPAATFQDTNYFTVRLSNIRDNPTILRTNTWADMAALGANWTQWIAPDQMCQSTNPVIAEFVQESLPTNYQAVLTPYDAARTLHRAVMKALTYESPPPALDAVDVLEDGYADCGGFAHLLVACLRNVGIPARMISGFWEGDTQWHCRVEFHLPDVDWLLADPTEGNAADPTGTYAYYFGYVPDANQYLAVDTGDAHILPYNNFTFLQVPNWWWTGGGTYESYNAVSYLQPNGVLQTTNSPNGSFQFYLSDVPTEGSVILQASSNLINWSAVATNLTGGTNLIYSFPDTNGIRQFYRAGVTP